MLQEMHDAVMVSTESPAGIVGIARPRRSSVAHPIRRGHTVEPPPTSEDVVDSMLTKLVGFVDSLPEQERAALHVLCQAGALTLAAGDDVAGFGFPNVTPSPGLPVPIPYPSLGKKACFFFC